MTLTVTKSESNDTVVITNDDDTNTPDTAEFDLIVGVNTLTVTVTAQGGTAKAYTVTLTRTPQTAPDAPTGLMATANGTSDINLEWTEPAYDGANAISGYKIQHSPDGNSPWTNLTGNTGNADTEYSDTGLDPRTTRHYRVFTINSIGTGPKSNIANATTDASSPASPSNGRERHPEQRRSISKMDSRERRNGLQGTVEVRRPELQRRPGSLNHFRLYKQLHHQRPEQRHAVPCTSHRHQDGRERRTTIAGDVRHTITHPTVSQLRTRLVHRLGERRHRDSNGRTERAGSRRRHDPAQGSTPQWRNQRRLLGSTQETDIRRREHDTLVHRHGGRRLRERRRRKDRD